MKSNFNLKYNDRVCAANVAGTNQVFGTFQRYTGIGNDKAWVIWDGYKYESWTYTNAISKVEDVPVKPFTVDEALKVLTANGYEVTKKKTLKSGYANVYRSTDGSYYFLYGKVYETADIAKTKSNESKNVHVSSVYIEFMD